MPPAPVAVEAAVPPATPLSAPTTIAFSEALRDRAISRPEIRWRASLRGAPQNARFRIAVDAEGIVRYCLLEQSSGDAALDEQGRHYLALCRFGVEPGPNVPSGVPIYVSHVYDELRSPLIWATASFDFGNDLELPPAP